MWMSRLARPTHTCFTSTAPGSERNTISDFSATSRTLSAGFTPCAFSRSSGSGAMS